MLENQRGNNGKRPLSEEEKTRRRDRERERRRSLTGEQRRLERERKRKYRRNMTEANREIERERQRLLRENFTEENRENELQRKRLLRENFKDRNWHILRRYHGVIKQMAVTPYTHIMGDCVPERLLPSLSDFLSNVPYKHEELSPNKIVWLGELLRSQIQDREVGKNSRQSDKRPTLDECTVLNALEPDRKRIKCDDTKPSQDNPRYTKILLALRSQVDDLYHLRAKHSPNEAVMKELQEIHIKLTNFIETA